MIDTQNKLTDQIRKKYEELGQDPNVYLEGLLWSKPITYWDYCEVDTLLSLQKNRTTLPDEGVFIMYHQVNELLFKMILSEIEQIANAEELTTKFFAERLHRVSRYFDVLASSFSIMMEGMEVEQYMKFRTTLTPASGFQSGQYRMIEICTTEFHNLIDARFRDKIPESAPWDEKINNIYWQAAGTNHETGEKSLTLSLFLDKYKDEFVRLAQDYEYKNIWSRFQQLPAEDQNDTDLVHAMRHLDHTINIKWVMAHYNAAAQYLDSGDKSAEATGGSQWKKYMHPKYQKRIFFPGVWTQDEIDNWGINNL